MVYRRYRGYRRRYRRSRFNRQYNSFNRRIVAARQMRDMARYSIKVNGTITMNFASGTSQSIYFFSFYQILKRNKQFQAMSIMFDQFQIRGVSIVVRPTFEKSAGTAFNDQLRYVSAIDRTSVPSVPANGGNNHVINALSYNDVCGYGSAKQGVMNSSSKNTIYHKIVATDLMERCQYLETSVLRSIPENQSTANITNGAVTLNNFVQFNPVFMMGVKIPASVTTPVSFVYEFVCTYDLQFRGTRFDDELVNLTANSNNHQ